MTLSSNGGPSQYTGDGVSVSYGYDFSIINKADVKVVLTTTAGANSFPVLDVDYSVTGVGDEGGGTIIFVVAPASGVTITLMRDEDFNQPSSFNEADDIPQLAYERAIDRLARQVQQLEAQMDRALLMPEGALVTVDNVLPTSIGNASRYLRLKSTELGFEFAAVSGDGSAVGIASIDGVSNDGGNIDLVAGSGITITPDDGANSITFAATGGGGAVSSVNSATGDVVFTGGTAIGITGTTIALDAVGIPTDGISGDKIHGGIISNFKSTGIDDGATATKLQMTDTRMLVTTTAGLRLQANNPLMDWYNTNGSADSKYSRIRAVGDTIIWQLVDDAYGSTYTFMNVQRSGIVCNEIEFNATAFDFNGAVDVSGNIVMSGTGAITAPTGTTAERPGTPANGMVRYNSTTSKVEMYQGGWQNIESVGALTDLTDVTITSPSDGEILKYDTVAGGWVNDSVAAASTALNDLTDVDTTGATTHDEIYGLKYDTVAGDYTLDTIPGAVSDLDDLGDVTITSPSDGEILKYDTVAGGWVNDSVAAGSVALNDLSDVGITSASKGHVVMYNGTSWENVPGMYNVRAYGATGDGSTDDTTAINNAIADVNTNGGVLYFPKGIYKVTAALTPLRLVVSGSLHALNIDNRRICVLGDGPSSRIRYSGSNPGSQTYLMELGSTNTGAANGKDHWDGWVRGLFFDVEIASGINALTNITGLRIFRIAYWSIQDCGFYGLGVGVQLHGALSGNFRNCQFRVNKYGVKADNHANAFSSCNAITFSDCLVAGNTLGGIVFTNGSFTFIAGNVEGNGQDGAGNAFGLKIERNGNQVGGEPTALTVLGDTYFEYNGNGTPGKADIWIVHSENANIQFNVHNCNFNRVNTVWCANNILVEDNSAALTGLTVNNCAFNEYGSYTVVASEKYIDITGSGVARNVNALNNYYNQAVQVPDFPTIDGTPNNASYISSLAVGNFSPPFAGALVYRSTAITISNATTITMQWNATEYDTHSIFNGTTGFIIPSGWNYVRITACLTWATNPNGYRFGAIKKNGVFLNGQGATRRMASPAFGTVMGIVSAVVPVTAGDGITLDVNHNAGSGLNINGGSGAPTWLCIEKIN